MLYIAYIYHTFYLFHIHFLLSVQFSPTLCSFTLLNFPRMFISPESIDRALSDYN